MCKFIIFLVTLSMLGAYAPLQDQDSNETEACGDIRKLSPAAQLPSYNDVQAGQVSQWGTVKDLQYSLTLSDGNVIT